MIVLAGSGSCEFAHEHPAVATGIAAGFVGLVPCLPAVSEPLKCVEIGAAVGVGIGGFVALVNTLFDTSAHDTAPDVVPDPDRTRIRTTTPPPPGPSSPPTEVDAGVAPGDAPADSMTLD